MSETILIVFVWMLVMARIEVTYRQIQGALDWIHANNLQRIDDGDYVGLIDYEALPGFWSVFVDLTVWTVHGVLEKADIEEVTE